MTFFETPCSDFLFHQTSTRASWMFYSGVHLNRLVFFILKSFVVILLLGSFAYSYRKCCRLDVGIQNSATWASAFFRHYQFQAALKESG